MFGFKYVWFQVCMFFFRLKAFMAVKAIESFPTEGLWLPGWAQMGTKKLIKK